MHESNFRFAVSKYRFFGLCGRAVNSAVVTCVAVVLRPVQSVIGLPLLPLFGSGRGAMPSHNTVEDVPAHANAWLINEVHVR